ncbi:interleukin-27 subunit beta [Thunnus albacares]|uniref:interleukin-27 subunit beta n=1 Tax=Thunnus maccoyii TaxID=8240 RepID=UPI001C4B5C05|nr:interleukin-27 subunit beta [Thunnus maccoyii]XP_044231662.1 interleukin-27 subunit beta [Thunnus albacares]
MAVMAGNVCVTVTLLVCVVGSQALHLPRAAGTSASPRSPPKVHCWCASFPNRTLCSWPEPSHSPPTHYIATYSERNRQLEIKQCQLFPPGSSSSALSPASSSSDRLWHCHLPDLKLLTDYIINITAVYSVGSSSHLSSFMLEEIVKPDPPVDIQVSTQHFKNFRNLSVEWSPPPTWANLDIFPLQYHLQYQWENRGKTQSVKLPPFEDTKVELKLASGRTYMFQVCAKDLLGLGECSAWSSPVEITTP